jgi:hypothetical protein
MNYLVSEIKILLDECDKAIRKEAKAIVCLKLFNILSKNLYFFFENKKFLITVINKCNEFKKEETFDKVLISNPEYKFSRDFIVNLNKFYENNIKYDMYSDDRILNDFDIFISDYMDKFIELNKETELDKENGLNKETELDKLNKETELDKLNNDKDNIKEKKFKNNYFYYDEIIQLDI